MSEVPAPKKTYKREWSVTILFIVFAFYVTAFITAREDILEAAKHLTMPAFLFLGGAFGIDAYGKQIRPYEGGSAYSSKNFSYPNVGEFVPTQRNYTQKEW